MPPDQLGPLRLIGRPSAAAVDAASAGEDGSPAAESIRPPLPVAPTRGSLASRSLQLRPSAAFLAQLIASKENLPQTRERRRAEPREAIAAYVTAARAH